MLKTFDIVIVNWNSGVQLKECVESVMKSSLNNSILNKVIIVDNDSKDDSINLVKNLNFEKLGIIKNKENLGFGKACNIGAKDSTSDFILFLNPDAMVYEDTFSKLFDYIDQNDKKDVAVYGVQLLDDRNNVQRNCAEIPSIVNFINRSLGLNKINSELFPSYTMENWDHCNTREVDQVMGSFFMIKRAVFEKLNGFDERFFVYYEELELSKRIKDSRYKSVFISEVQAYHRGGGVSEQVKAKRLFYNTRSRLIYGFKYFGYVKGLFLMIFTLLIEPITRTLFLLLRSKYNEILENLKGFGMLYLDIFNIIKQGMKK